ncbi:hypothetical protein J3R83DRAFT_9657 [Lanmaoa asiatica]|nr:hypothetical protein J3R83DRAFT_9657 [Lanmaoa asiatica]
MDDDVQYLGTKFATTEPLGDPCEAHRLVTGMSPLHPPRGRCSHPSSVGITLHVEKCGEKPAHDLTFYRACSGYVNIGRKSGSDDRSMRRENDDHNAVFTCQVVSARHAKFVFSDSGQVYVVDLHSRHGTHLLRRGEATSRMLQAEVETLLADGDVLTFGKVVGAGSYHVSPVTVRVELLSGPSPSEPSADRAPTPFNPPSPVLSRPRRLSSGRYGLVSVPYLESDSPHSSSSISVSSDAASSPSERESDVEDEHSCVPAVFRDSQDKTSVKIPAFRSFIREIYHNTVLHSPVNSDVPDEPLEDVPGSPLSAGVIRDPSPVVVVIEPFPKSRSHSPMEVATPSPSPPSEVQHSDPAVIGAWPASRPESPRHSSLEVEAGRSEVPPAPELDRESVPIPAQPSTGQPRITPLSNDALIELMHRLPPPPPFFPIGGPFSNSIASDFGLPSVPPPPPPHRMPSFHPLHKVVTECVNSEVKRSLSSIEACIIRHPANFFLMSLFQERTTALQETVSELKSRQSVTEEDVVDLQSHFEMLEPESERLLCRIIGAERNIATLSTLQGQMTALQNQVTTLRGRIDTSEPRPVETPMGDVRACADVLNNLVSEMKSLREDMEKRIAAKIEAIQTANAEALDALKEVVVKPESVRSLKRKRSDGEVEEDTPRVVAPVICCPPLVADEILVDEVPVPQVPIPQVPFSIPDLPVLVPEVSAPEVPALEPTRPKKRARIAVYTIAHTAAVMAIGAAATWSALAYS